MERVARTTFPLVMPARQLVYQLFVGTKTYTIYKDVDGFRIEEEGTETASSAPRSQGPAVYSSREEALEALRRLLSDPN